MMRVSAQRALAGQKGGLGSALSRMKLENRAQSRHVPSRAIASQPPSAAAANVDHSHAHKILLKGEGTGGAGEAPKPSIAVSPELAAYVAKRMT